MPRTFRSSATYNSAKRFSSTDFPQIYTCSNTRRRNAIIKEAKYSTTGTFILCSCYLYLTGIQAIFGSTPIPHPGNATSASFSAYFTAIVAL